MAPPRDDGEDDHVGRGEGAREVDELGRGERGGRGRGTAWARVPPFSPPRAPSRAPTPLPPPSRTSPYAARLTASRAPDPPATPLRGARAGRGARRAGGGTGRAEGDWGREERAGVGRGRATRAAARHGALPTLRHQSGGAVEGERAQAALFSLTGSSSDPESMRMTEEPSRLRRGGGRGPAPVAGPAGAGGVRGGMAGGGAAGRPRRGSEVGEREGRAHTAGAPLNLFAPRNTPNALALSPSPP
jgi:translation initiation factor IF-2